MQNIKKIAQEYNLKKSKSDDLSDFICLVKQLDEYEPPHEIQVSRDSCGQWLLDEACERFGRIQEKDYFGLRYTDKEKQRQWLDLSKNIHSQLKDTHPIVVSFRIKHYPASPLNDLKQDLACYYLYLQLRRDLYSGRLLGKSSDLYQLAAYAVQSQIGDFNIENEEIRYLAEIRLIPNLNSKTEAKIMEIHKTLAGLTADESEQRFLEKASQLDTYGVEPFYVKDQKGNNLYVGLTHEGVSTFQGSRRAHLFKWLDISKIHYQGKLFIIQVLLDEVFNNQQTKKKHVLGFKCETTSSAAALWKWANDRMCFFSLNRSSEAKRVKSGGGIFKRRKTFRFAGRCQREIMQMSMSMMQINEQGSIGLGRHNTLLRSETSEDEDYNGIKSKFNTMPSRERDKMLGTRDTLDSLFIPNLHGTIDNNGSQSPLNSALGSPRSDHKSSYAGTQSLEHITEEQHMVQHDTLQCHCDSNFLKLDPKNNMSRRSSATSSQHNLTSSNTEHIVHRKVSIDVVLNRCDTTAYDTVDYGTIKVTENNRSLNYVTRILCCTSLLLISLFLMTLLVTTLMFVLLGDHNDVSTSLLKIVSNPTQFVRPQQLSKLATNGFLRFSTLLSSSTNKN